MKNVFLYCWILLTISIKTNSQDLQNNNWLFGGGHYPHNVVENNNLLTFNPQNVQSVPSAVGFDTYEGCATVSDNNGRLLLASDGVRVWFFDGNNYVPLADPINNSNFDVLLGETSSAQNVIFVPVPNHKYQYYIVTISGATSQKKGIYYSKVDVECTPKIVYANKVLKDGTGTEVNSNYQNQSEALTSVIHSESDKYWVIAYAQDASGNGSLCSYEVNETEINEVPKGREFINVSSGGDYGICVKITPDTTGFALTTHHSGIFTGDFDNSTGSFSNVNNYVDSSVSGNFLTWGVEFSPNSDKLYYVQIILGGTNYQLNRIDFPSMDQSTRSSITTGIGKVFGLQRAIDGNIYASRDDANFLFVIDPNSTSTPFLNVLTNRVNLPNRARLSLPQWVWQQACESYLHDDQDVLAINPTGNDEARKDWIELTNTIESAARAIYHAEGYVLLLPEGIGNCSSPGLGFEAEFGSEFSAYIADCGDSFVYKQSTTDATNTATEKSFGFELTKQLNLYPNPANSILHLDAEGMKITEIQVNSIDGKLIKTIRPDGDHESIDVSGFSNGMYLINIFTDDGQIHRKKFLKN